MKAWIAVAATVAGKDLLTELRARERIPVMGVFALLVAIVFAFALDPVVRSQDVAAAMIWVAVIFAGMLGVGRSFAMELEDGALTTLLLAPVPPSAIFIGKVAANLVLLLAVSAVVLGAFLLFFPISVEGSWWGMAAVVTLTCVGFMVVGTLFSAMAAHTRLGDALLPVLVLPMLAPLVIFAAGATHRLLAGRPFAEVGAQVQMILAFDLVFLLVCPPLFAAVVEE